MKSVSQVFFQHFKKSQGSPAFESSILNIWINKQNSDDFGKILEEFNAPLTVVTIQSKTIFFSNVDS